MSEQSKYDIIKIYDAALLHATDEEIELIDEQSRLQAAFCEAYEAWKEAVENEVAMSYKDVDAAWAALQQQIGETR